VASVTGEGEPAAGRSTPPGGVATEAFGNGRVSSRVRGRVDATAVERPSATTKDDVVNNDNRISMTVDEDIVVVVSRCSPADDVNRCCRPPPQPATSSNSISFRTHGRLIQRTRRRGVVVSGVRRMNEVNARRARLVPGWVTVFERVYNLGM